jgi:hypothetical protein
MFGLLKKRPRLKTEADYQAEYRRLLVELNNQFAIGDSPQELVLHAMGVIDHEMNGNGGCNWVETDYADFLDTLRKHLLTESRFSSAELEKMHWAYEEIIACGRELEELGESSRNATEAVDYLTMRVVDWLRLHPRTDVESGH